MLLSSLPSLLSDPASLYSLFIVQSSLPSFLCFSLLSLHCSLFLAVFTLSSLCSCLPCPLFTFFIAFLSALSFLSSLCVLGFFFIVLLSSWPFLHYLHCAPILLVSSTKWTIHRYVPCGGINSMSIHVHVHACVVSWTQGHDGTIIPLVSGSRSRHVRRLLCVLKGRGKAWKKKYWYIPQLKEQQHSL